jgi:hypothetical protein
LSRILPGGGTGLSPGEGSLITGWPDNVLLISAVTEEDGKSAIFHIRETAGKTAALNLINGMTGKSLICIPVDVTGEILQNGNLTVYPFENKFYRIAF